MEIKTAKAKEIITQREKMITMIMRMKKIHLKMMNYWNSSKVITMPMIRIKIRRIIGSRMIFKRMNMNILIQKFLFRIKKQKTFYTNSSNKNKNKIKLFMIIWMKILKMKKIMVDNLKISIIIKFNKKNKIISQIKKIIKTLIINNKNIMI